MKNSFKVGSIDQFDKIEFKPESNYIHWSPYFPDNQIRLAFKCHLIYSRSLKKTKIK